MRKSVRIKGVVILALFLFTWCLWYAAEREDAHALLTVSVLNVGQGNALYIEAPSGRRVLINGGPDASVLRRLGSLMSPWDRSIDVVVATDADVGDVSGLIDVLQRYAVGTIIQPSVQNTSAPWNLFEKEAADDASSGTKILTARRGQGIDLGKGAYLQVLFPDRNLLSAGSGEGCVVLKIVYGATSFMLPCDSTSGVQNYLAMLDGIHLKSDALIEGATSSPIFLGYVAPAYTVVSGEAAVFVSDGETVIRR